MKPYNQQLQGVTAYSCSIYSFLHAILFDFWVRLEINNILWLNSLMKVLWKLLPKGAIADVIFPQLIKTVEKETGMSIGIKKRTIHDIKEDDGRLLWFKYETSTFIKFAKDGKITQEELKTIKDRGTTGYHFIFWKKGVVVDSIWGINYKLSLEDLKYALSLDMFYPACRTLYSKNKETEDMQKKLISLAKRKWHGTKYENFLNLL